MEWQLSAGQGPAECQLAVAKLLAALMKEFPDIRVIQAVSGSRPGTYRSVRIGTGRDLSFLEGSVQWICPSPYRPGHKRKNWFVDISPCAPLPLRQGRPERVRFETFRSGGKGGQHINKVETGVRAVDMESGLAAVSTEAPQPADEQAHRPRPLVRDDRFAGGGGAGWGRSPSTG